MRPWPLHLLVVSFLLLGVSPPARGDGGTVRLSEQVGGYQITLFTSPNPFRAGPVDVSVLVQDAGTGKPVPEARVTIRLAPQDRPEEKIVQTATREWATNKLFHAAKFDLPTAGIWLTEVEVAGPQGTARVRCELEALDPLPRWTQMWFWIALPIVPITLFVIHQVLVRRGGASLPKSQSR